MNTFNEHIDRLIEVKIVQDFMHSHAMKSKLCKQKNSYSLILYRLPYVVEMTDALIENYLDVTFSDADAGLMLRSGAAFGCSVDLGYLDRYAVRKVGFEGHPQNELFLSDGAQKMHDLYFDLEAIDKLLPLIETKGGLSSMRDGTFDLRFDFKDSVTSMYYGLKEKYLKCINNET